MARMYQGILGGLSGKIGNVVGSSWKGIPVLKTKPLSVANPQTAAQIAQRDKMEAIMFYALPVLATLIKPLWDRFASKMSGINAFISDNIAYFTSVNELIPASIRISSGKGAAVAIDSVDATNGQKSVQFIWTPNGGTGFALDTDEMYAMVINIDNTESAAQHTITTRVSGSIEVDLPSNVTTGDRLYCYLGARRADGTVIFDSSYLLKTV